ncbi:MAG: T9SS type A sorting domain-containing protein [Candidatus Limisoma sp.]
MKKLYMAILLVALTVGSAMAGKTADQVRIYLNPGHGSWGPNNRPCNTLGRAAYNSANPDTTGFFESNTNLHKLLGMLDCLVDAGVPFDRSLNQINDNPARVGAALDLSQHIVMSHVKVGPYPYTGDADDDDNAYNRPLSEIREEVEANNFDIFVSVHSNAATEGATANYPLYLYRGTDSSDYASGSKALCQHLWPFSYANKQMNWTAYASSTNVRGDVSFYGSSSTVSNNGKSYTGYLSVLKHGVPGFLVEGYFHTYQPARQRAMNFDVDRYEGRLYARGIIDYMGWKKETTGVVYGIVRDKHETYANSLYTPIANTNDIYKPLNGVVVDLYKDDAKVATYTTDNEYNGAFIFTGLEPGTYSLRYTADGYKAAAAEYTSSFTVAANETVYPAAFLESESSVAEESYVNYPDEIAGNDNFSLQSSYAMNASGEYSGLSALLSGKTIRRQIVRDGVAYVLALDSSNEPYIYSLNTADGTTGTISTSGTSLGENRSLKISDITFTADGILVGCSYGKNQFEDASVATGDVRGTMNVYKWAKGSDGIPTGSPSIWFTSQHSGNYLQAYGSRTIAYNGDSKNGALMTTFQTVGTAQSLRFSEMSILAGTLGGTKFMNKTISTDSNWTAGKLGDDYSLIVSPLADDKYIVDGSSTTPTEWQTAAQNVDCPLVSSVSTSHMAAAVNGASCFKYAGHSLMAVPIYANGQASGVKLLDITNGLGSATEIATGTTVTPRAATFVSAAGRPVYTKDESGNITAADIELYLVCDGKVTVFSTKQIEQTVSKGEYAYGLKADVQGPETTLAFNLTGDADDVLIEVNDPQGNTAEFDLGALKAGSHTYIVDNDRLNKSQMQWRIYVSAPQTTVVNKYASATFARSAGVAVDKSGSSDYQGSIYVGVGTSSTERAQGVYRLDANLNVVAGPVGSSDFISTHYASPFRLDVLPDGTVLACDWSDSHSGIYTINPANLSMSQMFAGTRQSDGGFLYNGTTIGGSTTCATVVGKGADTKLYVFNEDLGNVITRYDLGTATSINFAPNATFSAPSAKLINTNVDIAVADNGFWAAQSRGSGNNTSDVPSFMYCDLNGNIIVNGANYADIVPSSRSGVVVNRDNSILVLSGFDGEIRVFDITWNGNTPTLTSKYTFSTGGVKPEQIEFDLAENLLVANENCVEAYALPGVTKMGLTEGPEFVVTQSGIDGVALCNRVKVYPNPAVDVLTIEADTAITDVAVFAASGAAVALRPAIAGSTASLNVANLAPGIYFAKINGTKTVRFVKR